MPSRMPEALIVDAIRTPIGRAGKGSLKTVRADDLAAIPLRALIERNPQVDFAETNDLMMGAASSVGEQGYNIGRSAALLAGIDYHVPACTVNRFCASSLQTIRMAFHAIKSDEGDQYIAAGVKAVSRAGPGAGMMDEAKHPSLNGSNGSTYDVYVPMGMTAENVAERCHVTREQQDEWAVRSQNRAVDARDSGHFDPEIVPVPVPAHTDQDKEGNAIEVPDTVVSKDDGPRPGTTMEVLGKLKPAFRENGTVTAGNACPLNDGAAAVLVMSEEKAKRLGLQPKARIVASTVAAIRPEIMGLGPIPAIRALLEQTGVKIEDVDVVEINEAFAAQIVPCKDELAIPDEKLNPFGGAIALGHPFGMTGARIMTTLINGLRALDGTLGIESMCVAGRMGQAMLIERLS
jgi:acetyl-CoA C-acetyltransferase